MPPFSILFSLYVIYVIFLKKTLREKYIQILTIDVFLEMSYFQGYYSNITGIGEESRDCSIIASYILLVFSIILIYEYRNNISKKLFFSSFIYCSVIVVGIIIQFVLPYDGYILPVNGSWDEYIGGKTFLIKYEFDFKNYISPLWGWCRWIITALALKLICTKEDLLYIIKQIYYMNIIILLYGIIEFLLKNVFNMALLPLDITTAIFGEVPHTVDYILDRDGLTSLQGGTREPSHFVLALLNLFMMVSIFIRYKIKYTAYGKISRIKDAIYICVLFFLMWFSQGFTAIWGMFISGLIWISSGYVHRIKLQAYLKAALIFIIFILLGSWGMYQLIMSDSYYGVRIVAAISIFDSLLNGEGVVMLSTDGGMSTLSRLTSIFLCLKMFFDNFCFGLGLGAQTAHDITATILSNIGFIGLLFWLKFMLTSNVSNRCYDRRTFIIFVLIGGLFSGMGNTPLFKTFFVFVIEATSLYYSKEEKCENSSSIM